MEVVNIHLSPRAFHHKHVVTPARRRQLSPRHISPYRHFSTRKLFRDGCFLVVRAVFVTFFRRKILWC